VSEQSVQLTAIHTVLSPNAATAQIKTTDWIN